MDAFSGSRGTNDSHGFFGREVLEMGTLLFAAGAAHLLVVSLGHSDSGVRTLIVLGVLLLAFSALHRWRRHRRTRRQSPAYPVAAALARHRPDSPVEDRLWSVRVTVADVPGGLAALTGRFAALGVDIRLMQVHPDGTDAVDEFFVSVPPTVDEADLRRAVRDAGGRRAVVRTADVHELSDTTSRTLTMVDALVTSSTTLERCLIALAAAHDVRRAPMPVGSEDHAASDGSRAPQPREELLGTTMLLPAPGGGTLTVHRAGLPFTPVEFARCRALAQVACSLEARSLVGRPDHR
ncbi:ACT domain-containing protein [Nocardiopsis valliformis]|uniref:ACT domain-containing protein n=1 Tax=Nocardiopsis valliformis TaxID=239974 RepID=UPI0003821BB5|nr:ACT domain-containing protein [Nocardiopsis valliformis]